MSIHSEAIDRLTIEQSNKCAICQNEFNYRRKRKLDIDHKGKICGLLCAECKAGIEAFNRDPVLMERVRVMLLGNKIPDVMNFNS